MEPDVSAAQPAAPVSFPPLALPPALLHELLQFIIQHHIPPSTLIVCASRSSFLESLSATLPPDTLEKATIQQIHRSRTINTVFCPSVQHLRAYLATFSAKEFRERCNEVEGMVYECKGSMPKLLMVIGLVGVHRASAEWSAQGIGRTMAVAVEAAYRENLRLVVSETPMEGEKTEVNEDLWEEQIPFLSGAVVRASGDGTRNQSWLGQMTSLRKVLGRWCIFTRRAEDGELQ
jgi:hypothetical protein